MNNSFNWLHNKRGKFHIADIFISYVLNLSYVLNRVQLRNRDAKWSRCNSAFAGEATAAANRAEIEFSCATEEEE
jgi:hypothetical protein